MLDRGTLRMSALQLLVAALVSLVAGFLHTSHEQANNHAAVFAEYAKSNSWIAGHIGQSAGMVLITVGLLVLSLNVDTH